MRTVSFEVVRHLSYNNALSYIIDSILISDVPNLCYVVNIYFKPKAKATFLCLMMYNRTLPVR